LLILFSIMQRCFIYSHLLMRANSQVYLWFRSFCSTLYAISFSAGSNS